MNQSFNLTDVRVGQRARIKALLSRGSIRRRLMEIGLIEDTVIECVGESPAGDPRAYAVRGAVFAIRAEDGRNIIIDR